MAETQNEYGLPTDKAEPRRTAKLLPRFYRTESNKKFVQATLDQLTQLKSSTAILEDKMPKQLLAMMFLLKQ